MLYTAIIFDLDGVICHTDKYHYMAWKQLADKLGIYFDEQINNRLRGVSRMDSLEIILERYHGEPLTHIEKISLAESKNEIYKEYLIEMSPKDLSGEVLDALNLLKDRGLKLAIGSSSKNARLILKQIGLEDYFHAISDGNNITHSKPNPEVFLKAAEYIKENPSNCLVVEDAKAGIEAANFAGMDSAGIGEAADYPLTTYPLSKFSDLIEIIGS
ncbi:MAG: beta-phosphoglucomutase [Anaerolineaceae bacterium]|nr:MAG: beta-phosphoglucomutase [Anaerolineaceae bacterium]